MLRTSFILVMMVASLSRLGALLAADPGLDHFERKVRPILVEHCYKCHSGEAKEIQGGLRLDVREGWQKGGDSGQPAIVPGKPDESPLIRAVRHESSDEAMPPNQSKLSDSAIAELIAWVKIGAPDPRDGKAVIVRRPTDWESIYQERSQWWSLRPVVRAEPPKVILSDWARNEIDRFILAGLDAKGLRPAPESDRRTLVRRLSFALTGLPPSVETVERFVQDGSPNAYESLVEGLLESPHFGERWARHWMDVVHYADTHGYEWDVPAKNAWRYRDYLTRAWNADVSYQRLVLEQIAGDLIDPRIDSQTGLNESLLGPMALRLGERRHGDSAAVEGVSQEALANLIDTFGKAFLGTTLACAQCHDHKLDAIGQRDYYALAGVFMSTRWGVRCADAVDFNEPIIAELGRLKHGLKLATAQRWTQSKEKLLENIRAIPADEKALTQFPESIAAFWQRCSKVPLTIEEFTKERERRVAENQANLRLLADFTREDGAPGWRWEGAGMRHGLVRDGALVVADEGETAIAQILPAGRWSHVWSQRLGGSLQSPLLDPKKPITFSVGLAAGRYASRAFIVDQAFHSERLQFLAQPTVNWLTLVAGNFDTLEGSIDAANRRVYLELATKEFNNYFPPRTGYGGLKENDIQDERSWFGVTRIVEHAPGKPPLDELERFVPLFAGDGEWADRLANLILAAIERWQRDACVPGDVAILDEALRAKWLRNDLPADSEIAKLVTEYRSLEKKLRSDQTIGSAAEWNEARNERVGIRGSYTDFGDEVPRGNVRLFARPMEGAPSASSGRLELARSIASHENPLTARVFVNRVWLHLFGEGLVRTPDDFGHLGEGPTHPELLDYLAARFMDEGWSAKKLIATIVTSATWRQSSIRNDQAFAVDPENRLWHHMPVRRLEAEAIRDAMLAVSGRLDARLFGPPDDPYRTATDTAKRLLPGPLDGNGRRSIYTKITLMEPPRFLALFNQPLPKLTTGRRDVTNVPDQALALLNDPFAVAMAKHWSERLVADGAESAEQRVQRMFGAAFARPAKADEVDRLVRFVQRSVDVRQLPSAGAAGDGTNNALLTNQPAWQDAAHAIFNLKEFIYVP